MSVSIKTNSKDQSRIGEHAAKQPLSGTSVVTKLHVKGANGVSFVRISETKKAG